MALLIIKVADPWSKLSITLPRVSFTSEVVTPARNQSLPDFSRI